MQRKAGVVGSSESRFTRDLGGGGAAGPRENAALAWQRPDLHACVRAFTEVDLLGAALPMPSLPRNLIPWRRAETHVIRCQ